MIILRETERGFLRGEFIDHNKIKCSIQKSSLCGEECVWLGTEIDRMHLTRERAADLAEFLQHFSTTGNLPRR